MKDCAEATGGDEVALVPLQRCRHISRQRPTMVVSRENVFTQLPHVIYRRRARRSKWATAHGALGGAPATGKYPVRLFTPEEQKVEIRGGGPAVLEVHHTLAWPRCPPSG
ncbi:MAG: 5-deoxy-glucuronate isomerase [Caldilineaceae bacterium]